MAVIILRPVAHCPKTNWKMFVNWFELTSETSSGEVEDRKMKVLVIWTTVPANRKKNIHLLKMVL